MTHVIDDISFDLSDLVSVDINAFKVNNFAEGHIFLIFEKIQKPFIVLRASEVITHEFLKKYHGTKLYTLNINSQKEKLNLRSLLTELRYAEDELTRQEVSRELFEVSIQIGQSKEESILGICIEYFTAFYSLPKKYLLEQFEQSSALNQRSLVVATFAVMIAIKDKNVDFDFLKDLFTISFHLDSGLYQSKKLNHYLINACERQRVYADAREYLSQCNKDSLDHFISHPQKSYEFLKSLEVFIQNKELIEIVKLHHESEDGSGFPIGTKHQSLSSTEEYIALADKIVSFDVRDFIEGDGHTYGQELAKLSSKVKSYIAQKFNFAFNAKEEAA